MTLHVLITYDSDEQPWAHEWKRALAAGVTANGDHATLISSRDISNATGHVTVTWGMRGGRLGIMRHSRQVGRRHLILERGYIGDRMKWTSLSFEHITGRGVYAPAPSDGGKRFNEHFAELLKPWARDRPSVAVVMGQVKGDMTHRHVDFDRWILAICGRLLKCKKFEQVWFRPHPLELAKGRILRVPRGVQTLTDKTPLPDVLAATKYVVTFNSTSGVDSILAGVHTFAEDAGSMVYGVADRQVGEMKEPAREPWANALAWKQWSMAELIDGTAWSHYRRLVNA